MQNRFQTFISNYDMLNKLPGLTITILSIGFIIFSYFYISNIFRKVDEIEKNIFIVKDWIDNLEYIVLMQKGPVSQKVIDGFVMRERKPLEAELESLKMERQYLLDRIPLLGIFKK